jgi:SET domain-containing protein
MTTRKNLELLNQAKSNNAYMFLEDSVLIGDEIQEGAEIGKGVFPHVRFKRGEILTYYSGWNISRKDADLLRKEKAHSHIMTRTYCVDSVLGVESLEELGRYQLEGFGSLINHSEYPNVEIVNIDGHLCVKALRNIQSFEELYISYGKRYWEQDYERTEKASPLRLEIIQRSEKTTFSVDGGRRRRPQPF